MSTLQFLIILCLIGPLAGCVALTQNSEKATCAQTDWYELGRRDGSQGLPGERLPQHQRECGTDFNPDWKAIYSNGRDAGLVDYCEARNAFDMGRMGVAYYNVCPSNFETRFLAQYKKGQDIRNIETQNHKLDAKINDIHSQIVRVSDPLQQTSLASELEELQKLRAQNERDLSEISSGASIN